MTTEHEIAGPVRLESLDDGAIWRVVLDAPKANVIDLAMIQALRVVAQKAGEEKGLKAVCLEGAGDHFSFGASVPEHLPEKVGEMLPAFHALLREMADTRIVFLAAVRGQCLGGGLEIAAFCHRLFASPDAKLGQPEIRLGVLAPVASVILSGRMGRAGAEDLCLSGRILGAEDARQSRLVDEVADDPSAAALAYAREYLLPHSAASLRHAVAAVRFDLHRRLQEDLPAVERIYLEDLMATADATEGIRAFLEKRPPVWRDE